MGFSVFEIIKEKNLIFEGWNDKHLFNIALGNSSTELKNKFSDVGVCHAHGVGTIKNITPMIELAKRECLIISDSDKPAKEQQRVYRRDKGFGKWLTYQNIDSAIEAVTGEDFVMNRFITEHINLILRGTNMPEFDQGALPDTKNKLNTIQRWLTSNGMTQEQATDTVVQIKHSIFELLEASDIEDSYQLLLQGIPV